jgi:hypothetical protein
MHDPQPPDFAGHRRRHPNFLIAIESAGAPNIYPMNGRESQHFCRALERTMIVRKPNPQYDEVVCASNDLSWIEF